MELLRWWFDTALNFTPHLLVFATTASGLAAVSRQWVLAVPLLLVAIATIGWHGHTERVFARGSRCEAPPTITVTSANLQRRLTADQVHAQLGSSSDLLVLEEATMHSTDAGFLASHPHEYASEPRWLAVVSNRPLLNLDLVRIPDQADGRSVVSFQVAIESEVVTVVALHGVAPTSLSNYRARALQFDEVERIATQTPGPLVVLGDLNATVHSPALRGLLSRTGLSSVISGTREHATWPTAWRGFGIHIDHVLIRDVEVCTATVGPAISDHRAITVGLRP